MEAREWLIWRLLVLCAVSVLAVVLATAGLL